MTPKEFVNSIQGLKFENVFNPYADRCDVHDVSDAPDRRARVLLELLEAAEHTEVDAFWIGRSEEHTPELQSLTNLVCRLLLETKKHLYPWHPLSRRRAVDSDPR